MTVTNPTSSSTTNVNLSSSTTSSTLDHQSTTPVSARAPPNTPMSAAASHTGNNTPRTNSPLSYSFRTLSSSSTRSPISNQIIISHNEENEEEYNSDEENDHQKESTDTDSDTEELPTIVKKSARLSEKSISGLRKVPMSEYKNHPKLIILHYFILPFFQGAMYGLGEATARYWMRRWFGNMVTPPVSASATVIKKGWFSNDSASNSGDTLTAERKVKNNTLNNYSKGNPTILLPSPYEQEVLWINLVESIFDGSRSNSSHDRVPHRAYSQSCVGSLAIGAGKSWGRDVFVPQSMRNNTFFPIV